LLSCVFLFLFFFFFFQAEDGIRDRNVTGVQTCALPIFASISSLKPTVAGAWLGTSIPTKDFPGIGASIRIPLAAKARAKSSARWVILATFTPVAGFNSYSVTDGPRLTFSTVASTPKDAKVAANLLVFA